MSNELAIRILVVYESRLPLDGRATFPERLEAMRIAIEELSITSSAAGQVVKVAGGTVTMCGPGISGGGGGQLPANWNRTKNWTQG